MSPAPDPTTARPRGQRHLIDFDNPPARPSRPEGMSTSQVQRWVMSALAFVTIEHLAAGIAVAAVFTSATYVGPRVGLLVLAAVTGVLAVCAARLIHGRSLLSPWLLAGVVPAVVGAWFAFH